MDSLLEALKKVLADSFAFYLKTHYFHWNVTGDDFYQLHLLFEQIYTDVYESVDTTAEHIRALNAFAPGSFSRFSALTSIADELTIPDCQEMLMILINDNTLVLNSLTAAYTQADSINEIGVANYLQDRIIQHKKHGWMLRASIGQD
jgi:starvation-inducible DNA-binding protein